MAERTTVDAQRRHWRGFSLHKGSTDSLATGGLIIGMLEVESVEQTVVEKTTMAGVHLDTRRKERCLVNEAQTACGQSSDSVLGHDLQPNPIFST